MDYSALIWPLQAILGAFCSVLWFNFLDTKKKADKAADDLANYKVFVAEKYVTDVELKSAVEALGRSFEKYSAKLDVRLDKLEERILENRRG